ncbi:MAG: hypothetical protein JXN59_02525 [Anaerolineae bacterium]|nr:hypothetical protein [Anaerolineae bacterium]
MYYVICMAGEGARFRQQGFLLPKYMLNVGNRSMFARALGSLPIAAEDRLLFLVNAQQAQAHDVAGFVSREVDGLGCQAQVEMIAIPKTRGQLETAFLARDWVAEEDQLAIYNIDTAFVSATLGARFSGALPRLDGVLGGFPPDGQVNWSFAATRWQNGEQVVTRTAEKSPLPGFALTGLYHFSRAGSFFSAAAEELSGPVGGVGEYYVAPIYNRLIARGMEFVVDVVTAITNMGTPDQLKLVRMEYGDTHGA